MFITINNCKLFFDIYGSQLNIKENSIAEKPTLLVLHGGHGMVDHTLYVEFWSKFSDLAQVVFLDQRGCGRSDKRISNEWNLKQWADDVYQFCKTLGIKKPILAGVSMGGHVMCEYVALYGTDEISGLIFCNTEARFILEDVCEKLSSIAGEEIADIARQYFNEPKSENAANYQKECIKFYAKNAYTPIEIARCVQRTEIIEYYFRHQIQGFDYLSELSKIKVKTLFMVGEGSPFHLPIRAQEMADKIMPEYVHYHLFKEAGAPVYKDALEEAESVVRKFLAQDFN